jgi:hypothetical protein
MGWLAPVVVAAWAALVPARVQAQPAAPPALEERGDEPPEPPGDRVRTHTLVLEHDLFIAEDFDLRGVLASAGVRFPWPQNWVAMPGSAALLKFTYSSAIVPERSNLTVRLNGTVIASVPYRKDRTSGTLDVPIPPEALRPLNHLEFVAMQHMQADCENPFDEALWTTISKQSEIRLRYWVADREVSLADYPLPIVDEQALSPARIAVLRPVDVDDAALTTLARVLAGLGRAAQWRPVQLGATESPDGEAESSLVAVGTAAQLRALAGAKGISLPVPVQATGGTWRFVDGSGKPVPEGVGVVQLVPRPGEPGRAILVVGGNDAEGVRKATVALVEDHHAGALSGNARLVSEARRGGSSPADVALGTFPRGQATQTLAQLGVEETTVRRGAAHDVTFEFRVIPDERPSAKKHRARIIYSYGAALNTKISSVEVILNKVSLGSARLAAEGGERRVDLAVGIPPRLVLRRNLLIVRFHLMPRMADPCDIVSQDYLWATLHPDSEITIERDRWVELPDLSLLQFGFFPYADPPDLSQTALVLPKAAGAEAFRSFAALALALGRDTRSRRIDLRATENGADPGLAGKHLIVAEDPRTPSTVPALEGLRRLRSLGPSGPLRRAGAAAVLSTLNESGFGVVEQLMRPEGGSSVLFLSGARDELLAAATNAVTDLRRRVKLQGAAMAIHLGEDVRTRPFEAEKKGIIGHKPTAIVVASWIRSYYWLVIGLAFAVLFAGVITYRKLRRRHLQERLEKQEAALAARKGAPE